MNDELDRFLREWDEECLEYVEKTSFGVPTSYGVSDIGRFNQVYDSVMSHQIK